MIKIHLGWIAVLLLAGPHPANAGDAMHGEQLYESRCAGCHSLDANRIGPMHRGVVGRKAGSVAGFDYSAALRKSKLIWNEKTLDQWLADPERLIAGQKMGYRVAEAEDRADLIAFLKRESSQ